jgi:hypothetical protein
VDRNDLQQLSRIRLREAKALLRAGMADGAYYLAGYAVECGLKACIAKETTRYLFPEKGRVDSSYTHKLPDLVKVAGLGRALEELAYKSPEFRANWAFVKSWTEHSRYQRHQPQEAEQLLTAVGDRRHGVISWIKVYW